MSTIKDYALMQIIVARFRNSSRRIGWLLEQFYSESDIKKGKKKLEELKNIRTILGLQRALRGYEHIDDPAGGRLNILLPLWLVCLEEKSDCEDSSFLMAAILKGKIWIIIKKLTNSKEAGHAVFLDSRGNLWSNFRLVERGVRNIRDVASDFEDDWIYVIELTRKITIGRKIKR